MNRYTALAGAALATVLIASCSSSGGSKSSDNPVVSSPAGASSGSAASSSASTSSASAAPAAGGGITISGFAYSGELTVKAGEKITVTNKDSAAHTLTDKATHLFDTGNIAGNGGTGTFIAPKKAGTYKFGCNYHPNMAGTLKVTA